MNKFTTAPYDKLGFNFIPAEFLSDTQNEYTIVDTQTPKKNYRPLTASEIVELVMRDNEADDWSNVMVTDRFLPKKVRNCRFFGRVRIGDMEDLYLQFHDLRQSVGITNSTVVSCIIGDNPVIHNVRYLSHCIIGNSVFLINIDELLTTNYAKFGEGCVKQGEEESVRIRLEICNENGGRGIIPFSGLLPGDAWLWSRNRHKEQFQKQLFSITQKRFDIRRGYYGTIEDRCVIKDCRILKDVRIGSDAYIKGANKLKNLTIHSSPEAETQIGEGVELVNGIIENGCRIFYGVKAVRFYLGEFSSLKYGARLINSMLGANSTISCCEVLNSLIFPSHEQHHNNSFLIAASIQGQSNMAAGATVGSNHNSRGADGELIAARGFWPGLSSTLKHNSRFAPFTLLAKGNYPVEIDNPFPFALLNYSTKSEQLQIIPAFWFLYNMYALTRNAWKFKARDKRRNKHQLIEFSHLAPDTINAVFKALEFMREYNPENHADAEIPAGILEKSHTPVKILKWDKARHCYHRIIEYYAVITILDYIEIFDLNSSIPEHVRGWCSNRSVWHNIGGQLAENRQLEDLISAIETENINSWEEVHGVYAEWAREYPRKKAEHALSSLLDLHEESALTEILWSRALEGAAETARWICSKARESRAKDYSSRFRKMVYADDTERDVVLGSLEDDGFIRYLGEQTGKMEERITAVLNQQDTGERKKY